MTTGEKIALTANSLVGQTEVKGNLGFHDEQFQKMMESVGWKRGEAWCAYFAELVWKLVNVHDPKINQELGELFSGSTVQTWKNFGRSPWWKTTAKKASIGSVVIWQKYKDGEPQWSGHAGIVTEVGEHKFTSIEGNTNDKGGREGYIVAKKSRIYNVLTNNGLRVLGFIHPERND